MITTVLTTDVVNANNRIYPRHVVQQALIAAKPKLLAHNMMIRNFKDIGTDESVGVVNSLRLEGNKVKADIKFKSSKIAKLAKEGKIYASVSGVGYLQELASGVSSVERLDIQCIVIAAHPPPELPPPREVKPACEAVPDQEEI